MPTIVITSMGGAGSNNLVDTLRLIDVDRAAGAEPHQVVGTHVLPFELAKAEVEASYSFRRPRTKTTTSRRTKRLRRSTAPTP